MDLSGALRSVNYFSEFWTYSGSLTSPPCTEGLRWFMARTIMFTSVEQMQQILGVSTVRNPFPRKSRENRLSKITVQFSARAEREVWEQQINV